jgi:RNA polymerase sigma-70 factor (ECF subfamily)
VSSEPHCRQRCRHGGSRRDGDQISAERDDAEIIARVRAGDRDAYAELVRRHAPTALRTASLMGAGAEAEDVVQEAFVKAYGALPRFRDGAPFRPWLLRIVANEARNLHRAAGRRAARERAAWSRTEPLLRTAEEDDPVTAALSGERRAELLQGLGALSESHRQVVTCRYLLDLDEAETATVMGWPRGTVKSRLHRALKALAEAQLPQGSTETRRREVGHEA